MVISWQATYLPVPELNSQIEDKINQLSVALRTNPTNFTLEFIQMNGFPAILTFLQAISALSGQNQGQNINNSSPDSPETLKESRIHLYLLNCIKSPLNAPHGRRHILAHPNGILIVASISLPVSNLKIKIAALEILSGICLLPGGHKKVLTAMVFSQEHQKERSRFSRLMNDLDHSFVDQKSNEVELKTVILSFINALLRGGLSALNSGSKSNESSPVSIESSTVTQNTDSEALEMRLHLRFELLNLGIIPILEKLAQNHGQHNEPLMKHISIFLNQRKIDEQKFSSTFKFDATATNFSEKFSHLDSKSSNELFQAIKKKVSYTEAWQPFSSVLYHLALMPVEIAERPRHWLLIDKCVQSITLSKPDQDQNANQNAFSDINYLEKLDIKSSLQLLGDNHDLSNAKEKISKLKSDLDTFKAKTEKRRQEAQSANSERDAALRQCEKANNKVTQLVNINKKMIFYLLNITF